MSTGIIFYVLFALFLKHLVIDFPIYSAYVCRDIDTPGLLWYSHILLHGVATSCILYVMQIPLLVCIIIGAVDLLSHYAIDTVTVYCGRRGRTDPSFAASFRWVVNIDQYLHTLVYVSIVFALVLIQ